MREIARKLKPSHLPVALFVCVLVATLALSGCPKPEPPPPPAEPAESVTPTTPAASEPAKESEPVAEDKTILVIKTSKGDITAELYDEQTPITAGNFLLLAESGFYNGLTFHRVVPNFVIQGGDPNGDGTGGPGFTIPDETGRGFTHYEGILSMAKTAAPDTAGSQFFIVTGSAREVAHLNRDFSPFGKVTEGMDVVNQIQKGDKIETIEVKSTSPHAQAAREAAKAARKPGK